MLNRAEHDFFITSGPDFICPECNKISDACYSFATL